MLQNLMSLAEAIALPTQVELPTAKQRIKWMSLRQVDLEKLLSALKRKSKRKAKAKLQRSHESAHRLYLKQYYKAARRLAKAAPKSVVPMALCHLGLNGWRKYILKRIYACGGPARMICHSLSGSVKMNQR